MKSRATNRIARAYMVGSMRNGEARSPCRNEVTEAPFRNPLAVIAAEVTDFRASQVTLRCGGMQRESLGSSSGRPGVPKAVKKSKRVALYMRVSTDGQPTR